jgi:hypothetical protein
LSENCEAAVVLSSTDHHVPSRQMSFISNADHFTLGDGVYTNIHGNSNVIYIYGKKRHREAIEGGYHVVP